MPDPASLDISDGERAECRGDVLAQQVAVQSDRFGAKAGPFLDPGLRVVGQRDLAVVRVGPVAVDDLGFFECQPDLDIALSLDPPSYCAGRCWCRLVFRIVKASVAGPPLTVLRLVLCP